MKFWKTVLAVIVGILLASIISCILTFGFFGALSGGSTPAVPKEGVLKVDMSKISLVEQVQPTTDPRVLFGGAEYTPLSLWDAVQAIRAAAADPGVKFIYLKADGMMASLPQAEEFRVALEGFHDSGKAIIAYTENPSTGSYYLASVADKIYMSSISGAGPQITGVSTTMFFLKDILDRLGVNVQLIRHGKYKSAGEMYIRNSASHENLEQNQAMIDSMWDSIRSAIEQSRGINGLDAMIDNLELLNAKDMLAKGLVDEIVSKEELRSKIAVLSGKDSFKNVTFIPFADYAEAKAATAPKTGAKVAVIYAEGNIVEGDAPQAIAGDRYASLIADVRADESVKAVVLRVASPGGSVTASDKIKQEIDLLRKVKPVIASYGAYAASGGYWISNSCDHIFTDKTTLTGSIGVFSMIPDVSKTVKDVLHVGVNTVSSNKHGSFGNMLRPLDKDETAYMQASVEEIYSDFVATVAQGRELSPSYVDEIAQGRVWTGAESVGLKLTDDIGTLEDAVRYAAAAAGLDSWHVQAYPAPMTTLEMMMAMMQKVGTDKDVLAGTPFESVGRAFSGWSFEKGERFFARMPYEYVIK